MNTVFCLLIVGMLSAEVSAQSLADVARKERARQKSIESKITITNEQASAGTAGTPTAPQTKQPSPGTQAAEGMPKGPTDNKGRDEKYWRETFQKAREELKRAEDRVVLLDLRLKDLNTRLFRQSDMYNRENRLLPEITSTQADLETARQDVEKAKQKIAQLEVELRQTGGLPGWAR